MGIISSLFEQRSGHPSNLAEHILRAFGVGWDTAAGVDVTPETSLQVIAVYACVRKIAASTAALPLITYQRLQRGKDRAAGHPLYRILHNAANSEMTAMELRETVTGHAVLRGNGYAEIEWSNAGYPLALWPLRPDKCTPRRVNSQLVYDYVLPNGETKRLPAWRIFHLRGLGSDGIVGYNPIYLARQALGLAMATEEFGSRFFGNGARPAAVLEHPGKLSPEAQKNLRESIEERHQGLSRSHRLMILEEGMKLEQVGLAPEDSQFLETRKYQLNEIARLFDIQPHKIGDLDRATFSNIEQENISFIVDTLGPWLVRWEQRISMSLLSPEEQATYFAEHLVDGLLRGDINTRYQAYHLAVQDGILTRNEVRERENLNPLDGLDEPLTPLNMTTAGGGGQGANSDAGADAGTSARSVGSGERRTERRTLSQAERRAIGTERQRLAAAQFKVLEDVAGRVVRRETNDIRRAVDKYLVRGNDLQGFLLWLSSFYEEHEQFVDRNFAPAMEALAGLVLASVARELDEPGLEVDAAGLVAEFAAAYVSTLALRHCLANRRELESLLTAGVTDDDMTLADLLEGRLDAWAKTEAKKMAMRESVQAINATAKASYRAAGVRKLEWVASGENCPYCRSLDGKIVGIDEDFVEAGDFQPDGAAEPLKVRRNVGHPPVHGGCDCAIVAA